MAFEQLAENYTIGTCHLVEAAMLGFHDQGRGALLVQPGYFGDGSTSLCYMSLRAVQTCGLDRRLTDRTCDAIRGYDVDNEALVLVAADSTWRLMKLSLTLEPIDKESD